jgi:hypothetical protein
VESVVEGKFAVGYDQRVSDYCWFKMVKSS